MFQTIASQLSVRRMSPCMLPMRVGADHKVRVDQKVTAMNKQGLKKWATKKRFLLILAWRKWCDLGTGQNCAEELTKCAVRSRYVEPRDSVWGATLKAWVSDHNPPGWACKAACDLVLDMGWVPTCDDEWAAMTQVWMEAHGPYAQVEEALKAFPPHLDRERLREFVQFAFTE